MALIGLLPAEAEAEAREDERMIIWRPAPSVRVKALGVPWRQDKLLAVEVRDDRGNLKGVRPLGGTVEFGETAKCAVMREFKEELDIDVVVRGEALVIENIYEHECTIGHEVLFIFDVELPSGTFEGQDAITFYEDGGTSCTAQWFELGELDLEGGISLFPAGLKGALTGRQGI